GPRRCVTLNLLCPLEQLQMMRSERMRDVLRKHAVQPGGRLDHRRRSTLPAYLHGLLYGLYAVCEGYHRFAASASARSFSTLRSRFSTSAAPDMRPIVGSPCIRSARYFSRWSVRSFASFVGFCSRRSRSTSKETRDIDINHRV